MKNLVKNWKTLITVCFIIGLVGCNSCEDRFTYTLHDVSGEQVRAISKQIRQEGCMPFAVSTSANEYGTWFISATAN